MLFRKISRKIGEIFADQGQPIALQMLPSIVQVVAFQIDSLQRQGEPREG